MPPESASTKPNTLTRATLVPLGFVLLILAMVAGGVWEAGVLHQRVDHMEEALADNNELRRRLWDQTRTNADLINDVRESSARTEGQLQGISKVLESLERRIGAR